MDTKKTSSANIENKRTTFLLMGLAAVLALLFFAFEWADKVKVYDIVSNIDINIEEDMIEQTFPEETPPPPPPAEIPDVIEEITVVDSKEEVAEIDFSSEDNNSKAQEVIQAPVVKPTEPEEDENYVFQVVERNPEFPGGDEALMKYLSSNIKYPQTAAQNGIQGRVVCRFTVRKDGSVGDVEVIIHGDHPSLDREAIRVIESMPKWKPGQQRNKNVNCKFTLPVVFRLN
ncbi:MAG: energy transducer TonB [Bacteroidales bacterium]|nr:energy transducer TonB [Bacteroidales bacterium]